MIDLGRMISCECRVFMVFRRVQGQDKKCMALGLSYIFFTSSQVASDLKGPVCCWYSEKNIYYHAHRMRQVGIMNLAGKQGQKVCFD